jgi:predicted esterase
VFDLEDLRLQSEALAAFLGWARSEYGMDELTAVGFST